MPVGAVITVLNTGAGTKTLKTSTGDFDAGVSVLVEIFQHAHVNVLWSGVTWYLM
jgi:hypothetical protein